MVLKKRTGLRSCKFVCGEVAIEHLGLCKSVIKTRGKGQFDKPNIVRHNTSSPYNRCIFSTVGRWTGRSSGRIAAPSRAVEGQPPTLEQREL